MTKLEILLAASGVCAIAMNGTCVNGGIFVVTDNYYGIKRAPPILTIHTGMGGCHARPSPLKWKSVFYTSTIKWYKHT